MLTPDIAVGTLLDHRYRLSELLGRGGMSEVFLARDEMLGRDVALKVYASKVVDDADEARRRAEVTLLAGMNHPGLVVLYDAALESEPAYVTMEYVVGETLAERMQRGPLDATEAAEIVAAVAAALAFVHERGVVHRDVKPANILLPASPTTSRAKLADFGIARLLTNATITAQGTVMGTAAYISPEQASGRTAVPASDIYALGIVLIEALTGVRPFAGPALEAAAARLTRDPDLEDPALAPFRTLLKRMTARDPRRRPTADEVAADLAGAAPTQAMTPLDSETAALSAPTTAPAPRRRRALIGAVGVASTLLVATVVALALATLPPDAGADAELKIMPTGTTGSEVTADTAGDDEPAGEGGGNGGPKDDKPKPGKPDKSGKPGK